MTEYLPRSAWADPGWSRGGAQLTGSKLIGLADHWPGTTQDVIGDPGRSSIRSRIRSYYLFHVNTRGWSDIGYNFAIDQGGRVWDLRGLGRVGAHAASASNPDANHEWVGVLFIVGDSEPLSAKAIEAFQDFRHRVFLPRWPGRTRLTGHGRAPGVPGAQTSCPGPFVAARITDGTLARTPGGSTPSTGELVVATTDDVKTLWMTDGVVPAPSGYEESSNKFWAPANVIRSAQYYARRAVIYVNNKIAPNAYMLKRWESFKDHDGYSPRVYWRASYAHARSANEYSEQILQGQAKQAARLGAIENLLQQLLDKPGSPVDMAQIVAAAERGAADAMAALDIRITVQPAQEPDPAVDESDAPA